jgi:hypothetical protein
MKAAFLATLVLLGLGGSRVRAQVEASSGLDLRETLSALGATSSELSGAPRSGSSFTAGFRSLTYPTWKIDDHWAITGSYQFVTRPYFYEDFSTVGYGAKGYLLQSTLNYSRVSEKGSLLVRAGVLSSAFGSFLLRYDDASNPLIDMPPQYGYYYAPVTTAGLPGAQIDVTHKKLDARLQFANSSPANPRSLFAHDQYGNWAGGVGYTIHQGFRVGVEGYRGPYLSRDSAYFYPGEHNPSTLPATGLGIDAQWSRGHTSVQFEEDHFLMPYGAIPDYTESAGYVELKQVLSPRWYIAFRPGWTAASFGGDMRRLESGVAYRPNRFQLIKLDYEWENYTQGTPSNENTLAMQWVMSLDRAFSSR